jgi:hypothetical protein
MCAACATVTSINLALPTRERSLPIHTHRRAPPAQGKSAKALRTVRQRLLFEDVNACAHPYLTLVHQGRREFGSTMYLQASARSTYTGCVFATLLSLQPRSLSR